MSRFAKKLYNNSIPQHNRRDNSEVMSMWMGRPLSYIEIMSINSYLQNGHKVIVYVYNDIGNMHKDVELRDANEILPYSNFEMTNDIRTKELLRCGFSEDDKNTSCYSFYSDLFRYTLMYKLGGWWTDLDAICLKHYDFDEQYVFAFMKNDNYTIAPGVFKMPPETSVMSSCIRVCRDLMSSMATSGKTGPFLFSRAIKSHKMFELTLPYFYFYPFSFLDEGALLDGSPFPKDSYSIHIYNTLFGVRYGRGDIDAENCILSELKNRYLQSDNINVRMNR